MATGCAGHARWSDGGKAVVHSVTPYITATFRAICEIGSCRNDNSEAKSITVLPFNQKFALTHTLTHSYPFQTADLSKAFSTNRLNSGIRLDTLEWLKGVVCLQGRLGSSATQAALQSNGEGLVANPFTLNRPDLVGSGPCGGASAQIAVVAPVAPRAIVGLSKKVSEPVWIVEGAARLVELTYQLTAVNDGKRALTQLQISDNLDPVFTALDAGIQPVQVRAASGLVANPAYTGRGADTTLPTRESTGFWKKRYCLADSLG
ncbi:hypothetical protein [Spirosoma endbachense]|uniref:Uncharacterized protein n=1 Tax=Spirosoma endbachense TaxID=2666025 RepID=A0A6P1W810_9BACT|nr:hypothetical protein [Spirosoma endbachense]QHW00513.1 hypothetical protein GJR95_38260 [Spirosoma endbachense]